MLNPLVSGNETSKTYLRTVMIDFGMSKVGKREEESFTLTVGRENEFYIQAPEKLNGPIKLSFD